MSNDPFPNSSDSLIAPASIAFPVVPSDDVDLARGAKALYVGTGGDITLRSANGQQDVTLRNVASGTVLAIRVRAVRVTGTSADHLVGLA